MDLGGEGVLCFEDVVVAGLEDFYDDAGTATALAADLAAAMAHGEERGVGAADTLVELEIAVGFEGVEATFELREEVVDLGKVSVLPLLFFFSSFAFLLGGVEVCILWRGELPRRGARWRSDGSVSVWSDGGAFGASVWWG